MKVQIKLYTGKNTKKGHPVILYFRSVDIRKRVNIGWYFKKEEWNFETETPLPAAADYEFVYPLLMNYRHQIKQLQFQQITNPESYIHIIKPKKQLTADFYKFTDGLIEDLKKRGKYANAKVYENVIIQLKKIKPKLNFTDINYTTLKDFKNYKLQEGVKNSTIHNYLRTLRAIYNEGVLNKLTELSLDFYEEKGYGTDLKPVIRIMS